MAYSPEVLSRVQALDRAGTLGADAAGVGRGEAGSLDVGTLTRIAVRLSGGTIVEARYQVFGCSAAIASASLVAERLEGAPVAAGRSLRAAEVAAALDLPSDRAFAASLAVEAARAALDDVQARTGGRTGAVAAREPRGAGRQS